METNINNLVCNFIRNVSRSPKPCFCSGIKTITDFIIFFLLEKETSHMSQFYIYVDIF